MKITLPNGTVIEGTQEELTSVAQILNPSPTPAITPEMATRKAVKKRHAVQKLDPNHKDDITNFLIENADAFSGMSPMKLARKLNGAGKRTAYGHKWNNKSVSNFLSRHNVKI